MLDAVGLKEDHDDERPQSQNEATRRVPIFWLRFLQNKDNMANLTTGEEVSDGSSQMGTRTLSGGVVRGC